MINGHEELINRINKSGFKVYLAITGGGASFIGDFLTIPGGSNTIVGCNIPYSQEMFDRFVLAKQKLTSYCCMNAACLLASRSFDTCTGIGLSPKVSIGIGVTCSLAKNDERVGRQHKIYVVAKTQNADYLYQIGFQQGADRLREERFAKGAIMAVLRKAIFNEDSEGYEIDVVTLT